MAEFADDFVPVLTKKDKKKQHISPPQSHQSRQHKHSSGHGDFRPPNSNRGAESSKPRSSGRGGGGGYDGPSVVKNEPRGAVASSSGSVSERIAASTSPAPPSTLSAPVVPCSVDEYCSYLRNIDLWVGHEELLHL